MTTLIAVYDSDGCRGRCDARCYDAKDDHCDCICGGRNHGAGINQAIDNTKAMAEQCIEDYCIEHNINPVKKEVLAIRNNVWNPARGIVVHQGLKTD